MAASTITVETTAMEVSSANPNGLNNGKCALDEAFLVFSGLGADDCEPLIAGDLSPLVIELKAVVYSLKDSLAQITEDADSVIEIRGNGATIEKSANAEEDFQLLHASSMLTDSRLLINDMTLRNAETEAIGAALRVSGFDLELSGVTFINNYSKGIQTGQGRAGALSVDTGTINIHNCYFEGNMADNFAGAASFYSVSGYITDTTFSNNNAPANGAIYVDQSNLTIRTSKFIANSSNSRAGAIGAGASGNYLTIVSSLFQNNSAGTSGGAIRSAALITEIRNTLFQGNVADLGGALVRGLPFAREYNVVNSTFTENRAARGGAIAIEHGKMSLLSSTIVENEAMGPGGGIWMDDTPTASVSVDHTIIFSNNAMNGTNDCFGNSRSGGGYSILGYCDLPLTSTDISQAGVPLEDVLGPLTNNGGGSKTFEPVEGGGAHNLGSREYPVDIPSDQRGFPRIAEGRVDIGAHERSAEKVVGLFDVIFNHSMEIDEPLRFFDRDEFLAETNAEDATGPLPALGNQNANANPIDVGSLTFVRYSPSSFFFGEFSDNIPAFTDIGDTVDLALNNLEQFDLQTNFPVVAFGFDFVDPDGDGTKFHLLACASKFDPALMSCPLNDIVFAMDFSSSSSDRRFFGFKLSRLFSQVSIRELTNLNTNEYFGHFYTAAPE